MADRDSRQRRDLRAITAEGGLWSGMVGIGESYVPAFALAMGFGDVVAGLVATVPMLAGAILQLVTPWGVTRVGSYRRWVVACAVLQAASFAPLVAGAVLGRLSPAWLAAASIAYWGSGMAAGPAWNAWVTSLVPVELRARFFAHRSRVTQGALFAALVCGGLMLEFGRERGVEVWVFAGLFAAAATLRLSSSLFLARQSEAPGLVASHAALGAAQKGGGFGRPGTRRVLAYLVTMMAATNVASPFFTPYMLGPLGLSYSRFTILTAAAFAARVLILPWLGRTIERYGARPVLRVGACGIVPLPALWLVSNDFGYLLVVQVLSGCIWAAVELASVLSIFESVEEAYRTRVLAVFNVANAAAIAGGAALGAWIFTRQEGDPGAFGVLFVVSAAARLATLVFLRTLPQVEVANAEEVQLRTLAVRPSAGAIQRPILGTIESEDETEPAPKP